MLVRASFQATRILLFYEATLIHFHLMHWAVAFLNKMSTIHVQKSGKRIICDHPPLDIGKKHFDQVFDCVSSPTVFSAILIVFVFSIRSSKSHFEFRIPFLSSAWLASSERVQLELVGLEGGSPSDWVGPGRELLQELLEVRPLHLVAVKDVAGYGEV